jgi:hypothetical protein
MSEEEALEILENLREKSTDTQLIKKDQFMTFQKILMQQEDRINYIGIAHKGGNIVYTYKK